MVLKLAVHPYNRKRRDSHVTPDIMVPTHDMQLLLCCLDHSIVVAQISIFISDTLCIDVICDFTQLRNIFVTEINICGRFFLAVKSAC